LIKVCRNPIQATGVTKQEAEKKKVNAAATAEKTAPEWVRSGEFTSRNPGLPHRVVF
jgi:hypothetical protein